MMLRRHISFFVTLLIVFGSLAPANALAVNPPNPAEAPQIGPLKLPPIPVLTEVNGSPQTTGIAGGIKKFLGLESVPTSNLLQDVLLTALKLAAKKAAQNAIHQIVNSTINWINEGHNGNPQYIREPWNFLSDVAKQTEADFIAGSALGFLCSPFQAQIRLSIAQQLVPEYKPQCTLKDIGVNLDNFYKSFHEGGWNGWFAMTQDNANNPIGSYVSARIELDSRVANALGIANQQININSGFLNTEKCVAYNPNQSTMDLIREDLKSGISLEKETLTYNSLGIYFDLDQPAGACIDVETKTPGIVIKDSLVKVLGTGVDQLVNAKDFDDIISALMTKLINRSVLGIEGLFHDNPADRTLVENKGAWDDIDISPEPEPVDTCTANVTHAQTGVPVTWTVNTILSGTLDTYWHGSDIPSSGAYGGGTSLTLTYNSTGQKNANVDILQNGNVVASLQCTPIIVSNISCTPSATTIKIGQSVIWTANRGTLPAQLYKWQGEGMPVAALNPSTSNVSVLATYTTVGTKTATAFFYASSPQDTPASVSCSNSVVVSDFDPLAVSCSADVSTAEVGDSVHWKATITGGSGKFQTIQITGDESKTPLPPGISAGSTNINIWPVISQSTLNTINNNNANLQSPLNTAKTPWSLGPVPWSYSDLSKSTQHNSPTLFAGSTSGTTVDVGRIYFSASTTPYTASVKVVDLDPRVEPVTALCTGDVTISP